MICRAQWIVSLGSRLRPARRRPVWRSRAILASVGGRGQGADAWLLMGARLTCWRSINRVFD